MQEGGAELSFRLQGELERKQVEIQPLPPTPITPDAKKQLESWGIPEGFISRLQEVASSMRYDLCPQKAERIASNEAFIHTTPEGEEVVLPDYYDVEGRLDGECGGIAKQLLVKLHETGYITKVLHFS